MSRKSRLTLALALALAVVLGVTALVGVFLLWPWMSGR